MSMGAVAGLDIIEIRYVGAFPEIKVSSASLSRSPCEDLITQTITPKATATTQGDLSPRKVDSFAYVRSY